MKLLLSRRAFVLALVGGAAAAAQSQPAATPGFDSASHVYRCTGGASLPVVYLNLQAGDSFATTFVNGILVLMRSGPTGSGATYYSVDERAGYRWQVKGDLGNLWFRPASPGARETLMLQDCKVQR